MFALLWIPVAAQPFASPQARSSASAAEVEQWRREAAAGDAEAHFYLGLCAAEGWRAAPDLDTALHHFKASAEAGHPWGMNALGYGYLMTRTDLKEGHRWLKKASDAQYARAMVNLAWAYGEGLGVDRDEGAAFEWYQKAADLGDSRGLLGVGMSYQNGWGVEEDPEAAVPFLRRSAELGEAEGQYRYGLALYTGDGVSRQVKQGIAWMRKAAAQSFEPAIESLKQLESP